MKKIIFVVMLILLSISGCSDPNSSNGNRIGAVCKDGTSSSATGSGACSHHGGVARWIYD